MAGVEGLPRDLASERACATDDQNLHHPCPGGASLGPGPSQPRRNASAPPQVAGAWISVLEKLQQQGAPFAFDRDMASEIFGTAALFWVLIPVGLAGGALLLKLLKD